MRSIILFLLASVACTWVLASGGPQPDYALNIAIDVPASRLVGTARIDLAPGAEVPVDFGNLRVLSLTNARLRSVRDPEGIESVVLHAEGPVAIRYEAIYPDPEGDVIDRDKIVLRDVWYPVFEGTYRHRLTATLPSDFLAFSEADTVHRTVTGEEATYSFELPYPQRDWDGITFAASRQWVSRYSRYRDVGLSVHLLPGNAPRLDEFIRLAQRNLQRLEALLGDYPFKRLAIVENPLPVKYSLSMPTYILLSQKSVASSVPEDNALHHEIAHQWIGNAVLGAYEGGNWVEGLTSYLSDHLEGETMGIAWERRQRMMAAYQGHVADRAPVPIAEFETGSDRPSRIIGYAKTAILFHMLRRAVGNEAFFEILRDFVRENLHGIASWTDIRKKFERATTTDLGWFFDYWVDGAAIPELDFERVNASPAGRRYDLSFTITRKAPVLPLEVPVAIYFENGRRESFSARISTERNDFQCSLEERPVRVVLDEDYDIFRRLTPAEMPPTINTLLTRPQVNVVASPAEEARFSKLIEAFEGAVPPLAPESGNHRRARKARPNGTAAPERPAESGAPKETRKWRVARSGVEVKTQCASLAILGEGVPLVAELFGQVDLPRGGFSIRVLKHPRCPSEVVAILTAADQSEVDAAYLQLVDRPRYSSAAFNGGKLIFYEMRTGVRGISREVERRGR